MTLSYCAPADVRNNVAGTDSGTGTCAQLSDPELGTAINRASSRVSAWTGETYDPTVPPPDLIFDLTVQLATYYGTLIYRKGKALPAEDPVMLGYQDAMTTLKAISSGSVTVVPSPPDEPPGTPVEPSAARVINTIPACFTGGDSATEITPWGGLRARGAWGSGGRGGW